MSSVNNIEALREARNWKRPELAKRMGTTPQQVERLEKGQRRLSQEWIDKAASAFGVTPAEIIMPDQAARSAPPAADQQPTRSADNGETADIIALDLSLSMGPGTEIEDFVQSEPVKFDLPLLRSITRSPIDRLRLVRGIGTSMEPTFQANDRFLIDTTVREMSRLDGYYWITIEGAHGLKRLRPAGDGKVLVISENPTFDDIELDKRAVRIEGRAIWFARGL